MKHGLLQKEPGEMKVRYIAASCTVALILAGLCTVVHAENQVANSRPVIIDVALHDGGVLYGQVVNAKAVATANTDVVLFQQDRQIAATRTDRDGRFRFTGLKPGVYQLATPLGTSQYRLWAPHTAPPAAQVAIVVVEDPVVRGQNGNGALRKAAIATGVGIGIAGAIIAIDYNEPGS